MRSFQHALLGGLVAGGVFITYDRVRIWRERRRFLKRLTEAMTEAIDKPGQASARVPHVYGKTVFMDGIRLESDPDYMLRPEDVLVRRVWKRNVS